MPTKCVQNKVAAFKKQHRRNPTQSEMGAIQTECYKGASNKARLKIDSKKATEAAKKRGGPESY